MKKFLKQFVASPKTYYNFSFLIFATLLIYCFIFYHKMVLWDELDFAPVLEKYFSGNLGLVEFVNARPYHWHVVAYSFMLFFAILSDWNTIFEVICNLLFGLGAFYLITNQVNSVAAKLKLGQNIPLLFFVSAFFIFSLDQAGNWLWGYQLSVFICNFAAILTIILLTGKIKLLWAMLAALVSIYDFSTGIALLPTGFFLLLLGEENRKRKIIYLTIWSIFSFIVLSHFYFSIADSKIANKAIEKDFFYLLNIILYSLNYIGSSIARYAEDIAPVIALIGLVLCQITMRKSFKKVLLPFYGLCIFVCFAALTTAVGRIEFGTDHAFVSRYITFSNLFWVGLITILLMSTKSFSPKHWEYVKIFLVVIILIKIGNIANVGKGNAEKSLHFSAKSKELVASYPNVTDDFLMSFYWGDNIEQARRNFRIISERKLNIFSNQTR